MHDVRKRDPVITLQCEYQVTAVTFTDTAEQVISGGIDNDLKVRGEILEDSRAVRCGICERARSQS